MSADRLCSVTAASLVSIAVTPSAPVLPRGTSVTLVATGTFSDGTTQDLTSQAVWASSQSGVGAIGQGAAGQVNAAGLGSATVTATLMGQSGSTSLTVTNAALTGLAVSAANKSPALGTTTQLTAIGSFSDGSTQDLTSLVTFRGSPAGTVAISQKGVLSSLKAGPAVIIATSDGVASPELAMTIDVASLLNISVASATQLPVGANAQLAATGTYSDGSISDLTGSATWASADPSVVAVSGQIAGQVTGVSPGMIQISATQGAVSGSVAVSATAAALTAIDINPKGATVPPGATQLFVATGSFSDGTSGDVSSLVAWQSASPAIATISNAAGTHGVATAVAAGSATISASYGAQAAQVSFTVSQPLSAGTISATGFSTTAIQASFTAASGGAGGYSYTLYVKQGAAFSAASAAAVRAEATASAAGTVGAQTLFPGLSAGVGHGVAVIVTDAAASEVVYDLKVQVPLSAKQLFVVGNNSLGGNLGGISGADALCQARLPNGVASAKSVLADGVNRVACTTANCGGGAGEHKDWALSANTDYINASGTAIATTTAAGIFTFPLKAPVAPNRQFVSGFNTDWVTPNAAALCSGWTSNAGPNNNHVGNLGATDTTFLWWGNTGCWIAAWNVLCAEQ